MLTNVFLYDKYFSKQKSVRRIALYTFFQIFFCLCFNRRLLGSHICSYIQSVATYCFYFVEVLKTWPHIAMWLEREEY